MDESFSRGIHDFFNGDRASSAALALVGRLHEGIDFKSVFSRNGWDSGLEKLDDGLKHAGVVTTLALLDNLLGSELGDLETGLLVSLAVDNSDHSILPDAGDNVGIFRVGATDLNAAGSQHGEESFSWVDAIPEEIGMGWFDRSGAVRKGAPDFAGISFRNRNDTGAETKRGRTPAGGAGCASQPVNGKGVLQGSGNGFVDKDRKSCFENRPNLFEVLTPINALEENSVDVFTEGGDVIVELDPEVVDQRLRKSIDSIGAGGNVRAASLVCCDHTSTRDVLWIVEIVELLGKRHHM